MILLKHAPATLRAIERPHQGPAAATHTPTTYHSFSHTLTTHTLTTHSRLTHTGNEQRVQQQESLAWPGLGCPATPRSAPARPCPCPCPRPPACLACLACSASGTLCPSASWTEPSPAGSPATWSRRTFLAVPHPARAAAAAAAAACWPGTGLALGLGLAWPSAWPVGPGRPPPARPDPAPPARPPLPAHACLPSREPLSSPMHHSSAMPCRSAPSLRPHQHQTLPRSRAPPQSRCRPHCRLPLSQLRCHHHCCCCAWPRMSRPYYYDGGA